MPRPPSGQVEFTCALSDNSSADRHDTAHSTGTRGGEGAERAEAGRGEAVRGSIQSSDSVGPGTEYLMVA